MRLLHICNDFLGSKVHINLYQELEKLGYEQTVYHPLRNYNRKKDSSLLFSGIQTSQLRIKYSSPLGKYYRFFFRAKINYLYRDLVKKVILQDFDHIFATTLFSDGALAYKCHKQFNISYSVAVRSTDIHSFLKLRPDLHMLAKKILLNAENIIFISPNLKQKLYAHPFFSNIKSVLKEKSLIIPNGIDQFWINNINIKSRLYKKKNLNFLFIGRFDKNKNIARTIKALNIFKTKGYNIRFNIVGGGGNDHTNIIRYIQKKEWITYHGKISERAKLLQIYQDNDFFVMPSLHETFGLVYLEALTQGLPILFSKGEGIDGLFEQNIGIRTNPQSIVQIHDDITELVRNSELFIKNISEIDFTYFLWKNIAMEYTKSCLNCKS